MTDLKQATFLPRFIFSSDSATVVELPIKQYNQTMPSKGILKEFFFFFFLKPRKKVGHFSCLWQFHYDAFGHF